jgi:sulfate adenylyltransferase large subunit
MRENLKFVVVGHVDHGKSTLIGRLLYDTQSLPPDKMADVRRLSESSDGVPEFAFIMDHLEEERSRRITIDTAQIFFKTPRRDYVIIDAPGHKQFLKNMITGSSQAQAAVLLIDAQEGLREQTHRHAYMLSMLGLKQVVVVINKMDLVDYSEQRFNELADQITARLREFKIPPLRVIPISARLGENVAGRAERLGWYNGPTLLECLDQLEISSVPVNSLLRFPVQDIYPLDNKKVLVGRIASGSLRVGQEVIFHPCGKTAHIAEIKKWNQTLDEAFVGESIGVVLDSEFAYKAVKRGEIACSTDSSPQVGTAVVARLFWMHGEPGHKGERFEFKDATQQVPCTIKKIKNRMDSSSLEILEQDAGQLRDTEVAEVTLQMSDYVCTDPFDRVAETGRFVLTRDNDAVAGGIVC